MEYPFTRIEGQTDTEDHKIYINLQVQSEFIPVDKDGLTQAIQQWLLDNVPDVVSTTAERREVAYPVTQLPPLPA